MIRMLVVFDCTDAKRGRAIASIAAAALGQASEVALFVSRWRPAGAWPENDTRWDGDRERIKECDLLLLHAGNRSEFEESGLSAATTILYSLGGMVARQKNELWIDREVGPDSGLPTRDEMRALIGWVEGGKRLSVIPKGITVASSPRREALVTLSLLCGGYLLALDPESGSQEVRNGVSEAERDVPQQYRLNARRNRASTAESSWWAPLLGNQIYRLSVDDGPCIGEFVRLLDEQSGAVADCDVELLIRAWREAAVALRV